MPILLFGAILIYILISIAVGLFIAYPIPACITLSALVIANFIYDLKRGAF